MRADFTENVSCKDSQGRWPVPSLSQPQLNASDSRSGHDRAGRIRMGTVTLHGPLIVVYMISSILAVARTAYFFRARAMRAFAAEWGLEYIGPSVPPSWYFNTPNKKALPVGSHHFHPPRGGISQVWNVIEGQWNGKALLIFDAISAQKNAQPRTFIAYKTDQDPFGPDTEREWVDQSHGWTVLCGSWFSWLSWTMSTRRISHHMQDL
jgi:hypothetical protein